MEIVANPYAATDDGCGVTASSIETWKGTRAMFGRFVEVRLGQPQDAQGCAYGCSAAGVQVFPSMTLTDGSGRVLALNGVTCGFEGTGPRGAAQILAAEGFFGEAEALRVATTFREVRLRR